MGTWRGRWLRRYPARNMFALEWEHVSNDGLARTVGVANCYCLAPACRSMGPGAFMGDFGWAVAVCSCVGAVDLSMGGLDSVVATCACPMKPELECVHVAVQVRHRTPILEIMPLTGLPTDGGMFSGVC